MCWKPERARKWTVTRKSQPGATHPIKKFGLEEWFDQSKENLSKRWTVDSIDSFETHWVAVLQLMNMDVIVFTFPPVIMQQFV